MSLLVTALQKERNIWLNSVFSSFIDVPTLGVASAAFEFIEERAIYIGPQRIQTSFYLAKQSEESAGVCAKRRNSIANLQSFLDSIEKRDESTASALAQPKQIDLSTEADSASASINLVNPTQSQGQALQISSPNSNKETSLKEALMKNPSVIQLLNSGNKKGGQGSSSHLPNSIVVFRFKEQESSGYYCLPSGTVVGKIGSDSIYLIAWIKRVVEDSMVAREVHLIIKDGSDRLYQLLQENAKDPLRLTTSLSNKMCGKLSHVAYKECAIPFKKPAGLGEQLYGPDPHDLAASAKAQERLKKGTKLVVSAAKLDKNPALKISPTQVSLASASSLSATSASNPSNKQCVHCGSRGTPQWRRGPDGAGTLCNACGVKWKHGKLLAVGKLSNGSANLVNEVTRKPGPEVIEPPAKLLSAPPAAQQLNAAPNPPTQPKVTSIPLKKRKFLQQSIVPAMPAAPKADQAPAQPSSVTLDHPSNPVG